MHASKNGHVETVKILLSNPNIDVNIKRIPRGEGTALIYACNKNHIEIVKLLLAVPSIDVNAMDVYSFLIR